MAIEQRHSALVPLKALSLSENSLQQEGGKDRFTHIGGIVYAGNKKLVLLKQDKTTGALHVEYREAPPLFNPEAVAESDRVAILHDYDEIQIGVVKFGESVGISTHASLDYKPTTEVVFTYTSVPEETDQPEESQQNLPKEYIVPEDQLLVTFANMEPAIIQLKGSNMPEEVALFFTRTVSNGGKTPHKIAHMFFFKGAEDAFHKSLDSVMGLHIFLEQLTKHFEARPLDFQKQVLRLFDDHLKKDRLRYNSPTQEVLARMVLTARSRLYEETGDEKYREHIEVMFPEFSQSLMVRLIQVISRIARRPSVDTGIAHMLPQDLIHKNEGYKENARQAEEISTLVDSMIVQVALPTMLERLKTERLKSLRTDVDPNFGEQTAEPMKEYINQVLRIGQSTENLDEINDVLAALRELETLKCYVSYRRYQDGRIMLFDQNYSEEILDTIAAVPIRRMAWEVIAIVMRRKTQLQNPPQSALPDNS